MKCHEMLLERGYHHAVLQERPHCWQHERYQPHPGLPGSLTENGWGNMQRKRVVVITSHIEFIGSFIGINISMFTQYVNTYNIIQLKSAMGLTFLVADKNASHFIPSIVRADQFETDVGAPGATCDTPPAQMSGRAHGQAVTSACSSRTGRLMFVPTSWRCQGLTYLLGSQAAMAAPSAQVKESVRSRSVFFQPTFGHLWPQTRAFATGAW